MLRIYCILTGDDFSIVKDDTAASRRKIALLATCLMVPVILWFINAELLVREVLQGSLISSVVAACVVSFIIFLIERAVIMSNGSKVIAFFRIALGLVVALLGSVSMDEVIFKNDIDHQVEQYRQAVIENAGQRGEADYRSRIEEQKRVVSSQYDDWQTSLGTARGESDGTGGSRIPRVGPIARFKMNIARGQEDIWRAENAKLGALNYSLKHANEDAREIAGAKFNGNGLLIRTRAMFDLVQQDKFMLAVYILFTLLLFGLEFLVVIIKMCTEETNYERKVKAVEHIGAERIDRIVHNDPEFFDPREDYPKVRAAKAAIDAPSPAIFA